MDYKREEYEIQHFNFSVYQLNLEHNCMVRRQIDTLVDTLADSLIKKSNISIPAADNIRSKRDDITNKIMASIQTDLENFSSVLNKYFTIPENLLLAEDLRHENPYTKTDVEYYEELVAGMEKTFEQNKFLISALEAETEAYGKMDKVVELDNEVIRLVEESFRTNLSFQDLKSLMERLDGVLVMKEEKEIKDDK